MTEFTRIRMADSTTLSQVAAAVETPAAPGRPYLYYNAVVLAKGHEHVRSIVRKQLHEAGFASESKAGFWEQFGYNDDTLAQITSVPLPDGRTYVQVVTTANVDASAQRWMQDLADRIVNDNSVAFD